MPPELYRKYRPSKFSEVIGQPEAIKTLNDWGKQKAIPHFLLFTGPSGCGKTTLARILRKKLKCSDHDFIEVNAAETNGIDMVRSIARAMGFAPMMGACRVWLIDEAARLTKDAQSAFLKMLEDTPEHVYFMLATTDPQKLLPTIMTRASEIKVKALSVTDMMGLIRGVRHREEQANSEEDLVGISDDVCDKIIDIADGSARKALVLLHQVIGEEDEEKQLAALSQADSKQQAIEICRLLMKANTSWKQMAKLLRAVDDEPEGIRRLMLAYMTKVALSGNKRAIVCLEAFEEPYFNTGKAGLVLSCWNVIYGSIEI